MIKINLLKGNCLEQLKNVEDNSIDSIVTDPPYGLSFMGKKWDYDVPSVEIWKECLRVLKPGGHLLSFGGTRTYHRMVVNIEDAGFEIRDCIQWLYGSGFPKSTDVSKRIDKEAGAEREVIGQKDVGPDMRGGNFKTSENRMVADITSASTDSAKQWQGWGTALKPANEPICVARKPLEKGLTVAENVLKYGTGAINIDGCRIATSAEENAELNRPNKRPAENASGFMTSTSREFTPAQGRWPANIILDEAAAEMLDEQSGICKSAGLYKKEKLNTFEPENALFKLGYQTNKYAGEQGGASRFFYVAKSSKSDRSSNGLVNNIHPTCKPTKLMQYLIKLVTPPNGIVLDPFMGSGSTGVAARSLDFKFIGCEMNDDYFEIAEKRIKTANG